MLGFFTAIYSGLILVFACIGAAFVAYKLYQRYSKQGANNTPPNQEFENIRRERLQREEAASQQAIQSNLLLHDNTHQIVNRFKEQQAHLGNSIQAFDQTLEHMQRTNNSLDEAGRSLHYLFIEPMRILLDRIKTQFQQSSTILSTLSDALAQSTQSVAAREHELSALVKNLAETELSLRDVQLRAEYVKSIEKENHNLVTALVDMTDKAEKLSEIAKRQKRVIELLQPPKTSIPTSLDCKLFGAFGHPTHQYP